MPRFFQWLYLALSASLLLGIVLLLKDFILLILLFPLMGEIRLLRLYGRLSEENAFPGSADEATDERILSVRERVKESLKPGKEAVLDGWTKMLFKMRFAPRLRWMEIAAMLTLTMACLLFNLATPMAAYKAEIKKSWKMGP